MNAALGISADYDLEYSSAAFNRLRISNSAFNGAIFKVVDLKLAERSSVKALVNLNRAVKSQLAV